MDAPKNLKRSRDSCSSTDDDDDDDDGSNNGRTQAVRPNPSLYPSSIASTRSPLPPSARKSQSSSFSPITSSVPPLQQEGTENSAASPRVVDNAIQHSIYPHPPDGYNHSKVVMTSPVATATHTLPSWLKDVSQMPPLPVVGDPLNFLNFYELKKQRSSSSDDDDRENHNPLGLRPSYTSEFRMLAFTGDRELEFHASSILLEVFGPDSRMMAQHVYKDFASNATWQELAMLYRLDEYVGWFPNSLRDGDDNEVRDKFWADIWEAWWACCFSEREIWGDDIDDLISFLRRIIELKYWGLLERYSTDKRSNQDESSIHHSVSVDEHEKVNIREVWSGDDNICEWLRPAVAGKKKEFLGYLATLGSVISIYDEDPEVAISTALLYSKHGHKDLKRNLLSLVYYPANEAGNSVRQNLFDFFVEICFGNPQPLSTTLHLIPLLHRIQHLRQEYIHLGICRANELTRIFWYEAKLAARIGDYSTVINALVFVISYCVMNFNRNVKANRVLLEQCITLYDNIIINHDVDEDEDTVNFILKYTPFRGVRLIVHGGHIISWGDEVTDTVMAIRFGLEEYIDEDREKSEHFLCPIELMSEWCEKNG